MAQEVNRLISTAAFLRRKIRRLGIESSSQKLSIIMFELQEFRDKMVVTTQDASVQTCYLEPTSGESLHHITAAPKRRRKKKKPSEENNKQNLRAESDHVAPTQTSTTMPTPCDPASLAATLMAEEPNLTALAPQEFLWQHLQHARTEEEVISGLVYLSEWVPEHIHSVPLGPSREWYQEFLKAVLVRFPNRARL